MPPKVDYSIECIPLESIDEGTRVRREFGDITALMDSIKEKGLLHPPTVMKPKEEGGKYLLLAGGRRLKALHRLNISTINCRVYPYIDDIRERKHIELLENTVRKDLTWQESDSLIEQIHENKQAIHGVAHDGPSDSGWGIRDTAEILGVSKSSIQDSLTLAKAVKTIPTLAKCKTKAEAKRTLDKMLTNAVALKVAESINKADPKGGISLSARQRELIDAYKIGDCLEGMKSLPSASYDIVEIDWPYGQETLATASMKLTSKEQKEDLMLGINPTEFLKFAERILVEATRVVKSKGWLIVWYSPLSYATPLEMLLRNLGFRLGMPCIWRKSLVPSNASQYYLDNCYECCYLAGGPNAILYRRREGGNIFDYSNPARISVIHPTEKPIELLEEMLGLLGAPGSKVLVPFAGSGATLLAAGNAGMSPLGYDISAKYRPSYLVRVSESTPGNYSSYRVKKEEKGKENV